MARLRVEVVFATAKAQDIVALEIDAGKTVLDAFVSSGLADRHPVISGGQPVLGVFGRRVPLATPLRDGDRVEVYRPLLANPKEARRARASVKRPAAR